MGKDALLGLAAAVTTLCLNAAGFEGGELEHRKGEAGAVEAVSRRGVCIILLTQLSDEQAGRRVRERDRTTSVASWVGKGGWLSWLGRSIV